MKGNNILPRVYITIHHFHSWMQMNEANTTSEREISPLKYSPSFHQIHLPSFFTFLYLTNNPLMGTIIFTNCISLSPSYGLQNSQKPKMYQQKRIFKKPTESFLVTSFQYDEATNTVSHKESTALCTRGRKKINQV